MKIVKGSTKTLQCLVWSRAKPCSPRREVESAMEIAPGQHLVVLSVAKEIIHQLVLVRATPSLRGTESLRLVIGPGGHVVWVDLVRINVIRIPCALVR